MNTTIISFLAEFLRRLTKKSPKFFVIIKVIALIVSLISGVPALLEQAGVVLPEPFATLASKVVSISGVVAIVVAQLTVADPAAAQPK